MLQDALHLHQFLLDSDELKRWIEEKTSVCAERDYLEPTNLQGKFLKNTIESKLTNLTIAQLHNKSNSLYFYLLLTF